MKQIITLFTVMLFVGCTQHDTSKTDATKRVVRINIDDYEQYQSNQTSDSLIIIITPEQRDSLKKIGKTIKCPFGEHDDEVYYELERIVLSDSTIGIWYIQPDSNRMFLDQKYYTIKKTRK